MQKACIDYFNSIYGTPKTNPRFWDRFPLPEHELAQVFIDFYQEHLLDPFDPVARANGGFLLMSQRKEVAA